MKFNSHDKLVVYHDALDMLDAVVASMEVAGCDHTVIASVRTTWEVVDHEKRKEEMRRGEKERRNK